MLSELWKSLGGSFNKRWLANVFGPTLVFWCAGLWAWVQVIRPAQALLAWQGYGTEERWFLTAAGLSLVGVVLYGNLVGSMLPFLLRRLGFDPAKASAPFVATLVDVSGLIIYFTVASLILRGALL